MWSHLFYKSDRISKLTFKTYHVHLRWFLRSLWTEKSVQISEWLQLYCAETPAEMLKLAVQQCQLKNEPSKINTIKA